MNRILQKQCLNDKIVKSIQFSQNKTQSNSFIFEHYQIKILAMKLIFILFTQVVILFFSNLVAQKSPTINFLEDYKDHQIMSQIYLDDSTVITKTQHQTSGVSIAYSILITHLDLKNRVFSTEKMEIKSWSVFYMNILNCIKLNGEIFFIRSDKAKKETEYFMDQFKSNQLIRADAPFFKGLISEGYKNSIKIDMMNNRLLLTFYDYSMEGFIKQINFANLDRTNFAIINKYSHVIPKYAGDLPASKFTHHISAERFSVIYTVYNEKEDKSILNILVLNDSSLHQIQHEEVGEVDNTILYSDDNTLNLFIVSRHPTHWNSKLLSINDSNKLAQMDSKVIPFELLTQEYEPVTGKIEKLDHAIRKIDFNSRFKAFRGINNVLFLIQVGQERVPENSYINSNLLITKIMNEKIEWNQYIRRHVRFQGIEGDIFEDENNLIIEDTEHMHLIDENGKFIHKNESKTVLAPEVAEINFVVNKVTGEFKRTIGEIKKSGLFVTN